MPFCPQCNFEYASSVLICPECGVGLIERLPNMTSPAATKPDDSWVGICRIGNQMSSQMIRGLLDSNNIPSIIIAAAFQPLGRPVDTTDPCGGDGLDNDIVMVPREFHQEAELLLSAVFGEDFDMLDPIKL